MATTIAVETSPGSGVFIDLTAYLQQDSVTSKFNTVDLLLLDPPSNLLTPNQASLETDTSGWVVGGNCTLAQSAAQALDGTHALAMTSLAAGDMAAQTTTTLSAVIPGRTYTAQAFFRTALNPRPTDIFIQWWNAAFGLISQSQGHGSDVASAWSQATITDVAPALAVWASVSVLVEAPSAAGEVHYVDEVGLAPGVLQPWVPGGMAVALVASGAQRGVKLTDPAWVGTLSAATSRNATERGGGHVFWAITAINTSALPNDTAPFDLSDAPADTTTAFTLEDGVTPLELEAGTDWADSTVDANLGVYETEGTKSRGYSNLSVQVRAQPGAANQTLGRCTTKHPGLRPGNQFKLSNADQGYSAAAYQITQVTATWPAKSTQPSFSIEFGDTPETLALWTQINAPVAVPLVAPPPPAVIPPSVTTLGACSAAPGLMAMGGGVVTLASATFTVSHAPGKTLSVQIQGAIDARMDAWDNYVPISRRGVRAVLSGGIYTGAWQELPFGLERATYDLSSLAGIPLPDGTYTVSIQINTVEYNQMRVYGSWAQAAVTST